MLAQFVLSLERTGLPYMAVVVDDSLSMGIVDRYEPPLQAELTTRVQASLKSGTDASPSEPIDQGKVDRGSEPAPALSRENLAKTLLLERDGALLRRIEEDYKLRLYYTTGARASRADRATQLNDELRKLEPTGESTRLGSTLAAVLDDLRGAVPAGVILLTDGINTEGPGLDEAAAAARRRGVPLLVVGLGDDKPVRDLKLSDLLVDEVVFVDDVVNFEVKLTASGYAGREVRVALRRSDKPDVLAETKVTLGPDGKTQTIRLPYRPTEVGEFRFVVEVDKIDGESRTDNNRLERTVRVRKEQIRVLLVQGYPNFEFRYLRNLLARDNTIRLDTLLQDADPEHAEQDASALRVFPVRRDEVFAYDVIILGDADPKLLGESAMRNLVEFVNQPGKGGAVVFLAGPRFMPLAFRETPLARLMPIELGSVRLPDDNRTITEGFVVQPTELGLNTPSMQLGDSPAETLSIWEHLPPLYWMIDAPELKPGVRVLAVHPRRLGHDGGRLPVIAMQYVGAGKVLMHMTDETWRWRWRAGDVFFARYWVQTIRYLSRSKLADAGGAASLWADRREYRRGEPVRLRVRFADPRQAPAEDDGVTLVLERQGHPTQRIALRRKDSRELFEGVLDGAAVGDYHAWIASPTLEGQAPAVDFTVAVPPGEFEHTRMDAVELRRAAEETQGRFYTIDNAERLVKDLPSGRQVPVETLPPKPLWNQWPLLALFLVLLVVEWIGRKAKGMV